LLGKSGFPHLAGTKYGDCRKIAKLSCQKPMKMAI
jgi:hypothetical protein